MSYASLYIRCVLDISEGQGTAVKLSKESWQQVPVAGSSSGTLLGNLCSPVWGMAFPEGDDMKVPNPLHVGYVKRVTGSSGNGCKHT